MSRIAFQSTLPARGATPANQEPHGTAVISIHAPRTGSDDSAANLYQRIKKFQSTLPARGATAQGETSNQFLCISIHAPRTGSDHARHSCWAALPFQSTLPARGATSEMFALLSSIHSISIHAPRTGSDRQSAFDFHFIHHFNPRSPHGERQDDFRRDVPCDISIHAPRTGSDKRMQWRSVSP